MYRRHIVTTQSPEAFAFTHLSSGIHCIEHDGDWMTEYVSENILNIIGVSAHQLMDTPRLWIGRIHPDDVDAVRATLKSVRTSFEKGISYRFRDSKDRYRWIGYRCMRRSDDSIIGIVTDVTRYRTQEYSDRIHIAGRNALRKLLGTNDLNAATAEILVILGESMVVDRARLVRFRKDGRVFITHDWDRLETRGRLEVPKQLSMETVNWWKDQFDLQDVLAIGTFKGMLLPESVEADIKEHATEAMMAVQIRIYGMLEGFACFEVSSERTWLPVESEEARLVFEGYSRSIEHQVEERRLADEKYQLRKSEMKYRLLTRHSPVVLFGIDSKGIFTLSEGLGLESMGAIPGEIVGKNVYEVYRNYPDVLQHVNKALSGTESHGIVQIGENCFEVWFTPVNDENECVVGISGVTVDITRRHKLELQQTIMMRELDHRVKNNIAALISLVGLSQQSADSLEDFAKTLDGRLRALDIAHSALAKSHWKGVWMRDILMLTLQPFIAGSVDRIQFKGPDTELPGFLARPMCMVVHELVTNAVKHGSLSVDDGTVIITTEILNHGDAVRLIWAEAGGPRTSSNVVAGTGTSLIEGLVGHEMHGTVSMQFLDSGLVCTLEFPITQET